MQKKIAVLAGDGIGPEVTKQALKVLRAIERAFGHEFTYEEGLVGAAAIDETGDPFPKATEKLCLKADAVLFGAIGHPKYDNDPHAKVRPEQGLLAMRKKLGLFSNIRPIKSYPAISAISPLKENIVEGVDFVVFRELTGGIYFGEPRGRTEQGDVAFDTCIYSKEEILRITKLAFEAAMKRKKKVTLVDKANVLATSRLWRETVREYSRSFPEIKLDYMYIDNAAMKLIQNPSVFDVVLTENMFGDILTDAASVITGSLGMLPSASVGKKAAMFEPIHGSYPEVAGQMRANPIGAILSAAMMLNYAFDMVEESNAVKAAVQQVLDNREVTEDINPDNPLSTEEVGDKIATLVYASNRVNA
ncbi:MAG: 3-isopropylmalate dehydrogenase [Tunicatimonas sp.]|uniref:3-isopropylmalate dehydrogenase n=1 Tax=Tunicatimonas sp. TaxID=1940096 RepID=UPI003C70E882